MKKHILSIFTVSLSFSLAACSFKKADRDAHEDAQPTELTILKEESAATRGASQTAAADVANLKLDALYQQSTAIKTADQAHAVIEALEKNPINSKIWGNPQVNIEPKVLTALSYYNFAVVQAITLAPESAKTLALIERYKKMATEGCSEKMESCQNVLWLKKDSRSTKVMELIVGLVDKKLDSKACQDNCKEELKSYYDLLAIAFDVGNALRKPEAELLYMKRASQYAALFQKEDATERAFFQRHGRIFEHIVSNFPANEKNERFAAYVKAFKPWTYSRRNKNPFPFGVARMFAFAANNLLYTEDQKKLSPDLKKAILDSQEETDAMGPAFRQVLRALRSTPATASNFNMLGFDASIADDDSFYDEYFFMIDRLYREHLNIEEVGNIWQGSKKNLPRLKATLELYIKVEINRMLSETNEYVGKIIGQKDIPNESMFRQTIQKSEPLTKRWNDLFSRMENIGLFVGQQLRSKPSYQEDLKQIQSLIGSLKREAKFLGEGPLMLLLGYFMIDANSALKFTTWWGAEISIDATTIVNYMLNGGFSQPWFMFSQDTSGFNKTEIIYAFHFALNTGAFETFRQVKDSKEKPILDRVSFLKKALKKTMLGEVNTLVDAMKKLKDNRSSNAGFPAFMEVCENEAKKNKNYSVSVKLTDLQYYSLFGNNSKGMLSIPFSFYNPGGPLKAFTDVRNNYEGRLTQIKAMMEPLMANLEKANIPAAEVERSKKELEAEVDGLEGLKKLYLSEAVAQHRELSDCMNHLTWLERERQSQMFMAEIDHLGKVYDAMSTLRGLSGNERDVKLAEFSKSLDLGPGEKIHGDAYIYSRWDLLNRFVRFSKTLKPALDIEMPDSTVRDTLRTELQTVTFLSRSSGEPLTREGFISNGLTLLNSQGSNTLFWLQELANIDGWQNKVETLTSLYQLGFDADQTDDPKNSIQASELINELIETAKYVNIRETEKIWLTKMNRRELIPREKLRGFLFDETETEYRGILDKVYDTISNVSFDLDEAANYYLFSKNIGSWLFPPKDTLQKGIDQHYTNLVKRAHRIINDFNAAIEAKEKSLDKNALLITYRLDTKNSEYSPMKIDSGTSILVDARKTRDSQARFVDFHVRKTNSFYLKALKETEAK